MSGNRVRAGFTLVEVVLAATLMVLIFGAVSGIISSVLVGSQRASENLSLDNAAGEIEDVVAGDLAFLCAPTGRRPFIAHKEMGGLSAMTFYTAAGARTAYTDAASRGSAGDIVPPVHEVSYLVQPTPGGWSVFRGEKPLVDIRGVYYDDPVLLAENVKLFKVEAWDGEKWHDEWPAGNSSPMPALVRISVDLALADGRTRRLYIESAPPVEFIQKPEEERRASGGAPKQDKDADGSGGGEEGGDD